MIEGLVIYVIGCYLAYINVYNAMRWGRIIKTNLRPATQRNDDEFSSFFALFSWVGLVCSVYTNWRNRLKQGLLIKLNRVRY